MNNMITYSKLGYQGRLGNQMFQYAALVGIADKIGCSYGINYQNSQKTRVINKLVGAEKLELLEAFDLSAENIEGQFQPSNHYMENQFTFEPSTFKLKLGTDISGCFQSEKYFRHCPDKIRSEFQFKYYIKEEAERQINLLKDERQLVSIHVRRGDYVKQQFYHPVCSLSYYDKAIAIFKNSKFVVFSDDISWCQQHFLADNFTYVTGNNQFVDMCMMSLCDNHILANSSFSWWGAWLNPNPDKIVVAPKRWLGLAWGHNTKDLYGQNWRIIGSWFDYLEYCFCQLLLILGIRQMLNFFFLENYL